MGRTFLVRALDAATGETVWEHELTGQKKTGFAPAGLRCAGPSAFVAALSSDRNGPNDDQLFLWAFDRQRGALRWQKQFEREGIFGRILQLERRSLFVRNENRLQAYSRRQGRLIWETDPYPEGGWRAVDLAGNGYLAVAAGIFEGGTKSDAVIRLLK